jgi:hypothetical protein
LVSGVFDAGWHFAFVGADGSANLYGLPLAV